MSMHHLQTLARCGILLAAAFANGGAIAAEADQEIIVTATRVATPAERIGSSVTVITARDIERRQYRSVSDALQSVPSLGVVHSGGGIGKLTNVFSRGSETNHTLLLLDGIELNDPSNTDGLIDLSHIYIKDVERIEIVTGPQSTLYGSDAIGAVIQIFTKQGGTESATDLEAEIGSFDTFNQYASTRGGAGDFTYSANLQHTDTDGVSALSNRFRQPNGVLDDDGHENYNASLRLGYAASEMLRFDLSTRYLNTENDLDLNNSFAADDSDSAGDADQWFLGFNTHLTSLDGRLEQRLGMTYSAIDRKDWDDPDASNPGDYSREHNRGWKRKFDLQNDYYGFDAHVLTLGLETEQDVVRSALDSTSLWGSYTSATQADVRNNAVYLQDQFQITDALSSTLGVRSDDHDNFDRETTWRAALAYRLSATDTRLRGSYGTGFKAPTANQLFGQSVSSFGVFTGNPDLDPETSEGWEIGADQPLAGEKLRTGVTYYRNRITDLIVFTDNFATLENKDSVDTSGIESYLHWDATERLALQLDYAHTRAQDRATGEELRRRPLNKATLQLDYQASAKLGLHAETIYIDRRYDTDAVVFARILRPSYTLTNLAAQYQIDPQWQYFLRVDNVFDRDYEEPDGFEQSGVGVYTGVKLALQ
ncbi:MAG TPA: TonB-dependent receptor [Gammaproteobacteria bacterium]